MSDLSLEIESDELTALLGPSGCGKTTTMKMIAGLLEPTAGDMADFNNATRRRLSTRRPAPVASRPSSAV